MNKRTCTKCKEEKEVIEFELDYFSKKYRSVCKTCDDRWKRIFRLTEVKSKK